MYMAEERTRLQKIVLLILAAMIVIFGVLNVASLFRKGVVFEDALLRRTETEESVIYSGRSHGEDIRITVTPFNETLTEVDYTIGDRVKDVCTLETGLPEIRTEHGNTVEGIRITKNGYTLFEGGRDPDQEFGWYDLEGKWDPEMLVSVRATYSGQDHWDSYETSAGSVMAFANGPELVHRGSIGLYILMVVLTLLLMVDVAYPLLLFRLEHCCDVRDPEPSDFYLAMQKVAWVLYPILLLAGYIYTLTLLL